MSPLAQVSLGIHAATCGFVVLFWRKQRQEADRSAARLLAFVWCAWFVLSRFHDAIVATLPPPGPSPYAGARNIVLLTLDNATYFAWPALVLAFVRGTFGHARPWLALLAWVGAWAFPAAIYPALRGVAFFRFAAAFHLAALALEISAIASWVRLRERPRAWHSAAFVASAMAALPAIPFLSSPEARAGYTLWVLRGLVLGHVGIVAILGGELWSRET